MEAPCVADFPPDITAPSTNTDVLVPSLDYRFPSDDAWYGVSLFLQGETLTVKYNDFSPEEDDHFSASDFKTLADIHTFKNRFRPASVQLQDHQCSQVIQGMLVCVSYTYSEDDIRFYDALVDTVDYKKHNYVNGEEECSCEFKVLWRHGPLDGIHTRTNIGSICKIQSGDVEKNTTLESFLKILREKLFMVSPSILSTPRSSVSVRKDNSDETHGSPASPVQHKQSATSCTSKGRGKRHSIQTTTTPRTYKGSISFCGGEMGEDMDLGGEPLSMKTEDTGNFHFILVENMEKNLSPLAVVDFIYRHTSVLTHAYVFPSSSPEPYTRGAIVADSRGKLEKINEFLHDPAHIIMSSRGRPWVMSEKMLRHGEFQTSFGGTMLKSEDEQRDRNAEFDDIKLILYGTKEYKKAEQLKKSFMVFVDHLSGLYCRLKSDERKILQSFP
ncbi:uncharacterized protein LOC122059280 isoform X2 [Macadamia integrifolia]|uniref:uncharacterized protein LOC122059280 isoform X2 n=1 Tax=Macadamia integrifolia TaxID=60698 RepID=UPI001C527DF8|nr:uncharacterized protein LOC122059280 isoform X2 [Macadamia integrifolia]